MMILYASAQLFVLLYEMINDINRVQRVMEHFKTRLDVHEQLLIEKIGAVEHLQETMVILAHATPGVRISKTLNDLGDSLDHEFDDDLDEVATVAKLKSRLN